MTTKTIHIPSLSYWAEVNTGTFSDRAPRKQTALMGEARVRISSKKRGLSGKHLVWQLWRVGTTGKPVVKVSGSFNKLKKWAKRPRRKSIELGTMEVTYLLGGGQMRRDVYTLIDRGPRDVRGKLLYRFALVRKTYSGQQVISKAEYVVDKYTDASRKVHANALHLKETIGRRPRYHILRLHEGDKTVPIHAAGYPTIEAGAGAITSEIDDSVAELRQIESLVEKKRARKDDSIKRQLAGLPKEYRRSVVRRKVAGQDVEILTYAKKAEREKVKFAEHLMYRMLRWRVSRRFGDKTYSKWIEVSWLLMRWGQGTGYGRTVPTYTVVDVHSKEVDFRVPLTPKESETLSQEKTRLWGTNFVRMPYQAARSFIDSDMQKWFTTIAASHARSDTRRPDYVNVGKRVAVENIGSTKMRITRYGFLKRPVGKEKGASIIGGLIMEQYPSGKRTPIRSWQWQVKKETKRGGKYVVSGHGGTDTYQSKRTARMVIMHRAEEALAQARS